MNATGQSAMPRRRSLGAVREWIAARYLPGVGLLALLIYMFTYLEGSFSPPIRADGAGYYAYLPSYLIYHDLSFEADAAAQYDGSFPPWTFVLRHPHTGRYLNTYNIGTALLYAPFFGLAHLATWAMSSGPHAPSFFAFNHPANGYSFFYQHGAGLAGLFYVLMAVVILKRILEEAFGRAAALFAISGVLFGTNLLNYGTGETVNSHPATLFLLSVLFWATPRWYREPAPRGASVLLGAVLGLLYLTRPLNVLFFLIPAGYGLCTRADVAGRIQLVWKRLPAVLLVIATLALVLLPQLLIWRYATGSFLVNTYRDAYGWMAPRLGLFLFSLWKGMFFWFPITVLACIGFACLYRACRAWFWPCCATWAVFTLTVSSYFAWTAAGGFGNRYVVDISTLLAFPLAALYRAVRPGWPRKTLLLLAAACIAWGLFLMKLYYTREIGFYGLDGQALYDIFWARKEMLLKVWAAP